MELKDIETVLAANPDALAFVKGLSEKAALVTPEIEADLPKLGEYKANAAKASQYEKDIANLKAVNTDLEGQRSKWKETKGKESPEYLALQEQLKANETAIKALQTENETAKANQTKAETDKRDGDLKLTITTAAAKLKANDAEGTFILLKARGLTGFGEDGKPYFYKLNEQGKKVAVANADEMLNAWSVDRKYDFQGSGKGGVGGKHSSDGDTKPAPVTSAGEARKGFLASRTAK